MRNQEFTAGDKVAVLGYRLQVNGVGIVKRVMKSFVELEDGTKWLIGGCGRYPYSKHGSRSGCIKLLTEKHRADLLRQKLQWRFERDHGVLWEKFDFATLKAIKELLDSVEVEAEP